MLNFNLMKPQLTANEQYFLDFQHGYDLVKTNIQFNGFYQALESFNKTYPVGMSGYFKNLSDYFYAKGQCACLLDNLHDKE